MYKLNKDLIAEIRDSNLNRELFKGKFGLEKENLRVDGRGNLAETPHPEAFSGKSDNPYITADFSESQIEMITPPTDSPEEAYDFLDTLHNVVSLNLKDEYLWPQSIPPLLPEDENIPIARFESDNGDGPGEQTEYRRKLAEKYGVKKQLISGIHYNFSFDNNFLKKLHGKTEPEVDFRTFKDGVYMKVIRNMSRLSWMLIRLIGSSPAIDSSYKDFCSSLSPEIGMADQSCDYASSLRNGQCGYRNIIDYDVPLDSLGSYVKRLGDLIESGELISSKEYYSAIRPKNGKGDLESLARYGIEYVELRLLDLNPLYKLGISLNDIKFIHMFFIASLLMAESDESEMLLNSIHNNRAVADAGRNDRLKLRIAGKQRNINDASTEIFRMLKDMIETVTTHKESNMKILNEYQEMAEHGEKRYSAILSNLLDRKGFIDFHLDKARGYLEESRKREFNVTGYDDLELSTQILILDAVKRGIKVDILDKAENFIKLSNNEKSEYVKQATKTSLDNYSTVLLMENKLITKRILRESQLKVPGGSVYSSMEEAIGDFDIFRDRKIVVKPNTTNFGIGISIFINKFTKAEYVKAIHLAFDNDETILIEEFAAGKEYRVFIVGDEVVGVLHRVPANVTGDGVKTIRELVEQKNKNPLRGTGYRKPLEKIRLGTEEEMFLKQLDLTFDSVITKGKTVFLRENSNISTGGDSIDYTDSISESLKNIAVRASKAVGANIVGVDLMTEDITGDAEDNYNIIELNFNPAIHIHCFPFVGENRHLGDKILDILGFGK